jgi:hypothetical protein
MLNAAHTTNKENKSYIDRMIEIRKKERARVRRIFVFGFLIGAIIFFCAGLICQEIRLGDRIDEKNETIQDLRRFNSLQTEKIGGLESAVDSLLKKERMKIIPPATLPKENDGIRFF